MSRHHGALPAWRVGPAAARRGGLGMDWHSEIGIHGGGDQRGTLRGGGGARDRNVSGVRAVYACSVSCGGGAGGRPHADR